MSKISKKSRKGMKIRNFKSNCQFMQLDLPHPRNDDTNPICVGTNTGNAINFLRYSSITGFIQKSFESGRLFLSSWTILDDCVRLEPNLFDGLFSKHMVIQIDDHPVIKRMSVNFLLFKTLIDQQAIAKF